MRKTRWLAPWPAPGRQLAGPAPRWSAARPSTHRAISAGAGGQLGPDGVGLLGEGRLDLGGGGILRQAFLRQLDDL